MECQKLAVFDWSCSERPVDAYPSHSGSDPNAPITSKHDDRLVVVNINRVLLEKGERLDFGRRSWSVSALPVAPDETAIDASPPRRFCLKSYCACDFRRRDVSINALLRLLAQSLDMFQRRDVLVVVGVIACRKFVHMKDAVRAFRDYHRRFARHRTAIEEGTSRILRIE